MFPDELHVSSFLDKIPTLCLDSGIVSPLRLHWVKGVCMFRCNLPPALLAEQPGSLTCHCSNTGWDRHQIRFSTERNISRRDSNSQPFNHESGVLPSELSRSPFDVKHPTNCKVQGENKICSITSPVFCLLHLYFMWE